MNFVITSASDGPQERLGRRTIADFSDQWTAYRDSGGYYGSLDIFRDMFRGLLAPEDVGGCRVMEIGTLTPVAIDSGISSRVAPNLSAFFKPL